MKKLFAKKLIKKYLSNVNNEQMPSLTSVMVWGMFVAGIKGGIAAAVGTKKRPKKKEKKEQQ